MAHSPEKFDIIRTQQETARLEADRLRTEELLARDQTVRESVVQVVISALDKALAEGNPTVQTFGEHKCVLARAFLHGDYKYSLTSKEMQAVSAAYLASGWGEAVVSSEFRTEIMAGGDSHCLSVCIELYTTTKFDLQRARVESGRAIARHEQQQESFIWRWGQFLLSSFAYLFNQITGRKKS